MAEKFEVLNDREHTLRKAHIMVGGLVEEDYPVYISVTWKNLRVVPGLLVIVREIMDNSIDEHIRSNGKAATKIIINMNQMGLSVEDNGRGIPIEKYKNEANGIDEWRPVLCWTRLRAGTSFTNHDLGPSSNGVGSSVANILSLSFVGETWDGKNHCRVECSDNMENINVGINKDSKHPTGTKVTIEPDFERFGVSCFSPDHIIATKERIVALSAAYPEITFVFNGEKISTKKAKDYVNIFQKPYVLHSGDNYFFAVMPTEHDEYYQQSYIDGLFIKNGGTHEAYVAREVCYALRDAIKKKHKIEMSPAEIKRGLFLLFNGRFFPQMKFDSQTKERLTNSEAEVKAYLGAVNFEKLAKDIMGIPEIIDPIIEAKLAKQIAAEKRAVTLAQKKMAKKYVEKHLPAKSKNVAITTLLLTEGDSAKGMGEKVRNIEKHGFFPLRGMPLNTYGVKEATILENKELNNIMSILGLKFKMSESELDTELNYGKIGLLADADYDGQGGIVPLLINFFSNWPSLFRKGKICVIPSPRYIIAKNRKKSKERIYCYSQEEYEAVRDKYKGYEIRYIKGLGSLDSVEYADVLNHEERWIQVELDDLSCLDTMFSSDVSARREIMGI